jgi:hypothetical protein
MKHHEVTYDEMKAFLESHEILMAASSRERKKLVASLNGGYSVLINHVSVFGGRNLKKAVAAYNSVTESFDTK